MESIKDEMHFDHTKQLQNQCLSQKYVVCFLNTEHGGPGEEGFSKIDIGSLVCLFLIATLCQRHRWFEQICLKKIPVNI